jgi:hypothetical protein
MQPLLLPCFLDDIISAGLMPLPSYLDIFFQWHCDSLNAALYSIGSIRGIILFKVSLKEDNGISFIEISANIRHHGLINGTTI